METRAELEHTNSTETINLSKLLLVVRKSIIWIIIFLLTGVSSSYLIVRYTKPVFESSSLIKLDFENEANTLGLVNNGRLDQDLAGMSGEIEILRSRLFLSKVADAINYRVAYHYYGRYLTDERYKNSPFVVSYKVKNPTFFDRPIDIRILDGTSFELYENLYRFGDDIVLDGLNLLIEKTPYFNESSIGKYFFIINSQESVIGFLKQSSSVNPENFNAKTIRINFRDFNKHKARDFLTAIDTLYLQYTKEAKNQTLDQKLGFVNEQIQITEERLQDFEEYFEDFTVDNMTVSLEGDIAQTIVDLGELDEKQFELEESLRRLELIKDGTLSGAELALDPFILSQLPDFLSSSLKSYTADLALKNEKLASYNENTHVIEQIELRLSESKDQLDQLLVRYAASLEETLQTLRLRRATLENSFAELPSRGTEYNKNRRLYALQESFLQSLRQSKMQLELTKAGTVTDGVLLSSAGLPLSPISPKKGLIIAAGGAASMVLSFLFIVIRYFLNNEITSLKELEGLTTVPILGSVPYYKREKLPLTKLVVHSNSKSAIGEALRTIRTNMDFLSRGEQVQTISITSTISGEGKTFIAVNLGAIIASSGKRVCILDLDMRRPKVHMAFGEGPAEYGASTILAGSSELDAGVRNTRIENLNYLPAGPVPPNPSELVLTRKYEDLLASLKQKFDIILIDTPPVGLVSDGVLVMKSADLQFYAVRANYSKREFARSLENLKTVNQFERMAVIFNGAVGGSNGYGYGYGYGSYGGYGYYEEDEAPKNRLMGFINSLF